MASVSARPNANSSGTTDTAPPRRALRVVNTLLFGAFAALGFGLVARPALLCAKGLGLLAPVLPWNVPRGAIFLAVATGLTVETLRLGVALAGATRLRARARAPLLLLVLAALGVRLSSGAPSVPSSATARMVAALRTAADALDRGYAREGRYAPDLAAIDAAFAALAPSPFVYRGHELPLRAVVVERTSGAQTSARPGDLPGAIYLAVSADRTRVFLSALSLDTQGSIDLVRTPAGRPLLIEARFGTHSAPGRDPLVPEYPGMQSTTEKQEGVLPGSRSTP